MKKPLLALFLLLALCLLLSSCESLHTHILEKSITSTLPTCEEKGVNVYICSGCSETKIEEIPATGHTEVVDKAIDPTCTKSGLTEGRHCSSCNAIIVKQTIVPAKGHTIVEVPAREPTCTNSGATEGTRCTVCERFVDAPKVIPALGHDTDGTPSICARCGVFDVSSAEEVSLKLLLDSPGKYEGKFVRIIEELVLTRIDVSEKYYRTYLSTGTGRNDYDSDRSLVVYYYRCVNYDECAMIEANRQKITVYGYVRRSGSKPYLQALKIIFK